MNKDQFLVILQKYLSGAATAEEQHFLYAYYNLFQADRDVMLLLSADEKLKLKLKIKKEIDSKILETIADTPPKRIRLWPEPAPNRLRRLATAAGIAAAIAAVVFGVWFFNAHHPDGSRHPSRYSGLGPQDIAPGKNGATITMGSGKVIQLSDQKVGVVIGNDKLAYNDGSEVAGEVQGNNQELTASTAKGQTYQFTLPDGTKVWLNADSKISFPSQFSGKERKIMLRGEAYFEVVHNAKQPFRVESETGDGRRQVVEDIGTEFNINAYIDEATVRTTLVEGSAKVIANQVAGQAPNEGAGNIVLKPNQQAILSGANRIAVRQVDADDAVAWKNGDIQFDDKSIPDIMRQIARWYDVQVVYEGPVPSGEWNGSVSRLRPVSQVLRMMEKSKGVRFRIAGKTIFVSK